MDLIFIEPSKKRFDDAENIKVCPNFVIFQEGKIWIGSKYTEYNGFSI